MNLTFFNLAATVALFVAMSGLQVAGHAMARREARQHPEKADRGLGAVEGAVFGLLALLLGFSFSGAIGRFEARRELIVQEAVALGSSWQLLDVVDGPAREELRTRFRDYTDTRIAIYRYIHDQPEMERLKREAERLQGEIWERAVAASKAQGSSAATVRLLGSLNEMFDLATKRFAALQAHLPGEIFVLLIVMAMGCAFLAGYSLAPERGRHWLAILAFSFLMALTIYVIVDLEFPRMGLIKVDAFDALIVEARAGMR